MIPIIGKALTVPEASFNSKLARNMDTLHPSTSTNQGQANVHPVETEIMDQIQDFHSLPNKVGVNGFMQ